MTAATLTLDMMNTTLSGIAMRPMTDQEFAVFLENVNMDDMLDAIAKSRQDNVGATRFIRKQVVTVFNGWTKDPINDSGSATTAQPQASSANRRTAAQDTTSPDHPHADRGQPSGSQANETAQVSGDLAPVHQDPASNRKFFDHKVFSSKQAVGFYAKDDQNGHPSIYMEFGFISNQGGGRKVNWDEKTIIKITQQEMPEVMQTLLGFLPACKFAHHGQKKDKGFQFENQDGKIYIKAYETGKAYGIPMLYNDANYVLALFIRQWLLKHPWMTDSGVMMQLRYLCNKSAPTG